jgi:hypothetical protein
MLFIDHDKPAAQEHGERMISLADMRRKLRPPEPGPVSPHFAKYRRHLPRKSLEVP